MSSLSITSIPLDHKTVSLGKHRSVNVKFIVNDSVTYQTHALSLEKDEGIQDYTKGMNV